MACARASGRPHVRPRHSASAAIAASTPPRGTQTAAYAAAATVSAGAARVAISRSAAGRGDRGDRVDRHHRQLSQQQRACRPAGGGRRGSLRTGRTVELAELRAQLGAARARVDMAFDVGDLRGRQDALQETGVGVFVRTGRGRHVRNPLHADRRQPPAAVAAAASTVDQKRPTHPSASPRSVTTTVGADWAGRPWTSDQTP